MKIIYITAGAAGMYCGSCLRDNALAAELLAEGHDVTLVPIYTPTLTDEANVSLDKVFFGGISVYLQQHSALFRKTPWLLDKIWDSKFALKMAARRSIPVNPELLGELTVSMLEGEDGRQRKELRKLTHWMKGETPPDIINLPNSLLISLARPIKRAVNRPVVCTLQGEELFLEGLEDSYRSRSLALIRDNIKYVDGFIAVSEFCADFMSRYLEIPHSKIHVVPLGINLEGYSLKKPSESETFRVGYFARVAPEKGLHLLCEAYNVMRKRENAPKATLEVAGYLAPEHKPYLEGIERQMSEWGLAGEFSYKGVLDREQKIEFLRSLDALSVPTTYNEPKGIFLLEAMASGVPVVQPRRGAFPEIIEKTRGGLLVEPDDANSLAEGLVEVWNNTELRRDLGRNGFAGVREHYDAASMARRALEVYKNIAGSAASKRTGKGLTEVA